MITGDAVHVSIEVAIDPDTAFQLFTQEVDLWWRRGPVFRASKMATLRFEPYQGGRFLEIHDSNGNVREIGKILLWEPPERFIFEWRGINFAENERTEVEVCFEANNNGTLVKLIHRGWSTLAVDHPVRHGNNTEQFISSMSQWWALLLETFQKSVRKGETK